MKNKSLRAKLFLLSGFLIAVALVVGAVGYWSSEKITEKFTVITDVSLPNIKGLLEMDGNIRLATVQVLYLTLPGATEEQDARAIKTEEEQWAEFDKTIKEYESIPFTEGEKELFEDFKKKALVVQEHLGRAMVLAKKNKDPQSAERKELIHLMMTDVRNSARESRAAVAKLKEFHVKAAEFNQKAADNASNLGVLLSVLTLLVGCVSGGAFAWFFSGSLVKTLRSISDSISESSLQVSSASGQIAASSQQLSQAATEQAASLEETASSIEEMSAMVKKNSDNAKNTASVSTDSQNSAEKGKQAVEKMLHSMDAINQSNAVIMQQIDHSNNQIGEIVKVIAEIGNKTKVINDIVFQTKLLSFNASVEAARAGEHGKGFAVVAEEVGNLAQMSGNAAKEISSLLESSTQKVEGIVHETKTKVGTLVADGKAKVEEGTNVAKECSEILNEIVKNVASVSLMSTEIATASEEQSRGVNEITKAMGQLDAVTQTNAATSEEAASAAEELSAQAESLKGLVNELVVAVNGRADGFAAPVMVAKQVPAKSAGGKVVPFAARASQPAAPMKKAAGDERPSYDDSRFTEV
ncbi:MAG: methyl-accepting chemotaxis protein [Bacteriovoracia bacterium]